MILQALKEAINRRQHARHASEAAAVIHLPDGRHAIRCTVQDISLGGARLRLETSFALPLSFTLTVPAERIVRSCTLVWRNDEEAGVRFR